MAGNCGSLAGPGGTFSIVQGQISTLTNYATQAFNGAQAAVNALASFRASFMVPQAQFTLSPNNVGPFVKGTRPTAPAITFTLPDAVLDPALVSVNTISAGNAPTFTATEPVISLPPRPAALTAVRPGDPPTPSVITLPDQPDDTIPPLPALNVYRLPEIAPLDLSGIRNAFATLWSQRPALDFADSLGDNYLSNVATLWPSLLAKQASYVGANSVNDQVIAVISEFLNGSIGIPAAIDAQSWGRDYAELDRNIVKAEREAREGWSARGETMPAGVLDFRLAYARQEATKARQGVVRDRMVKRNEWMIENYKAVVQTGLGFLDLERKQFIALQTLTETFAYHAFDVAERIIKVEIAIKELVRSTWVAQAGVFDTWLKTELAELEKIRAELEVQQLIGKINSDLLAQYNMRLEGIKTVFSLYKDKIEALNLILGQDKLRFDSFDSLVKAYTAEVGAWGEEWGGYGKAVDGELGRTKIFESLTQAFAEQMRGYQIGQETARANEQLKIEGNRAQVELFGQKINRFGAQLRSESERVDALVKSFQANTALYDSDNRAESSRYDGGIRALELDTRQGEAKANISLKQSEVAINELVQLTTLLVHALSTVAQTESSLAGAAMGAAHVQASIHSQDSDSIACQTSYNYSIQQ
jgi:hypothetical protein